MATNKRITVLAVSAPELVTALDSTCSKRALIELYLQALAAQLGHCDEPCSMEELIEDANPVLRMRGDRLLRRQ